MIHCETNGDVAVLRLEHGKVNVLDVELLEAFERELDQLQSSGCRAVVLTGTGKAFSAGVDLFRVLNGGQEYLQRFLPLLSRGLKKLFLFPKPVIAAVNGHALAGGCILACACDYRIMAQGPATIGVTELRVGVPFPPTILEILRFAMAPQFVQEVVYSGKPYAVQEALRRGIVDEICEPEALLNRACEVALSYAETPRESFAITKLQLRNVVMERAAADPQAKAVEKLWNSPEIHNVVRSYLQKTLGKNK